MEKILSQGSGSLELSAAKGAGGFVLDPIFEYNQYISGY